MAYDITVHILIKEQHKFIVHHFSNYPFKCMYNNLNYDEYFLWKPSTGFNLQICFVKHYLT